MRFIRPEIFYDLEDKKDIFLLIPKDKLLVISTMNR